VCLHIKRARNWLHRNGNEDCDMELTSHATQICDDTDLKRSHRTIAETIIGDDFFPVVCSEGNLSRLLTG